MFFRKRKGGKPQVERDKDAAVTSPAEARAAADSERAPAVDESVEGEDARPTGRFAEGSFAELLDNFRPSKKRSSHGEITANEVETLRLSLEVDDDDGKHRSELTDAGGCRWLLTGTPLPCSGCS